MDTAERIEATKARVEAGRAILAEAAKAGPPCTKCRSYKRPLPHGPYEKPHRPRCGHPAYENITFNPATGRFESAHEVDIDAARAPDGLCGPAAILFERWSLRPLIGVLLILSVPAAALYAQIFG